MKRILLFGSALLLLNFSIAQITQTVVGTGTYDLQTNSSIQNRLINHGNGTLSASWIYSQSFDIGASDRGTGYNYFNGTSWGASPSSAVESVRVGWPTMATTGSGNEVIIAHAGGNLNMEESPSIGAGTWSNSSVNANYMIWPKSAVGGPNDETIHVFSVAASTQFGGTPVNGVNGALLYQRSLDGGVTWDILDQQLSGFTSADYYTHDGDGYAIDARGNTVVVVYFGRMNDLKMMKSTDNGASWNETIIIDVPGNYDATSANTTGSPIGWSDFNGDGIADTVTTSDGYGSVFLDDQDVAHVVFGSQQHWDFTAGDSNWNLDRAGNALMYWNEGFGSDDPVKIAESAISPASANLTAGYNCSMASMPDLAIASGTLYVTYAAVTAAIDGNSFNQRHLYAIRSDDGCTWTSPIDITANDTGLESVYACLATTVDNNIHVLYQRDAFAGSAVRGDHVFLTNDYVYLTMPVSDFTGQSTYSVLSPSIIVDNNISCNGGSDGQLTVDYGWNVTSSTNWSNGGTSTTESNLMAGGYDVTISTNWGCSSTSSVATVVEPTAINGTLTTVNSSCGASDGSASVAATGGTGTLAYNWDDVSNQTSSTAVNLPAGSYNVTITDVNGCTGSVGGSVSDNGAPSVSIASTSPACAGYSDAIADATVAGGQSPYTYAWSNGTNGTGIINVSAGTYTISVTDAAGCLITNQVVIAAPQGMTITVGTNNATCGSNDGSANANTTGGTPPYSYLWSNGNTVELNTNLATGNYTISVTDVSGCVMTEVASIGTLNAPTLSILGSDPSCNGGSTGNATANVVGGASPIVYAWSSGQTNMLATGLGAGTYFCTITDANGCISIDSVVLNDPAAASITTAVVNSSCGNNDGSASVGATGSGSPFTYLWNDAGAQTGATANNLSSGTYTVTITNSVGCEEVASTNVSDNGGGTVSFTVTSVTCPGDNDGLLAVFLNGATATTYNWNTGQTSNLISNISAGTYVITVQDNVGCNYIENVEVDEPAPLVISIAYQNATIIGGGCNGSAVASAAGGTGAYTYDWSEGTTGLIVSNLCAGNYILSVTDDNGCTNADTFQIVLSSSVQDLELTTLVNVFPNPNNGQFNLRFTSNITQNVLLSIHEQSGKVVFNQQMLFNAGISEKSVQLENVVPGLYFGTMRTATRVETFKILIE